MNDYKQLQEKYKILFKHEKDSLEPFAMFGFECGIGWYNIIKNACMTIYQDYDWECRRLRHIEENLTDIAGYTSRINTVGEILTEEEAKKKLEEERIIQLDKIELAKNKLPRIVQIKEKFGTLRMYMDNVHPEYKHVEIYAELMSATTCEQCGDLGRTYRMGWHQTLCKKHAIERYGDDKVESYDLN